MPMLVLLLLFVLVPILEIYVIIQVGGAIGALPTIALLIVDSIVGAMLMRSQGRAAWRRFQAAVAQGRVPARETVDGALVIFGGALLLAPGFCTDVVGILLLLPPTRAVIRAIIVRRVTFGLVSGFGPSERGGRGGERFSRGSRPGPGPSDTPDVEGSATEIDPERRRLP
jgi:UPF0716 protein FxsA